MLGLALAGWAAALGLTAPVVVSMLGWAADPRSGSPPGAPLRLAVDSWLLAHHVGLRVAGGHLGIAPLGLTALLVLLLVRVGRVLARLGRVATPEQAARAVGALAGGYAALACGLALAVRSPAVAPAAGQAFLAAGLIAALSGGYGVYREAGARVLPRLAFPAWAGPMLAGGLAGTGVLAAGGALIAAGSVLGHAGRAADLAGALQPGAVGVGGLSLLCLVFFPNAALAAAAYAVGPGFAVGVGTRVAPFGVHLGAVPALPLFAGLPQSGPAPAGSLAAFVVPVAAGIVAARVVRHRYPGPLTLETVGVAMSSGLVTGAVMALLAALAGGPGPGLLAALGPSPWQLGLASAGEVGLAAAATVGVLAVWRGRSE